MVQPVCRRRLAVSLASYATGVTRPCDRGAVIGERLVAALAVRQAPLVGPVATTDLLQLGRLIRDVPVPDGDRRVDEALHRGRSGRAPCLGHSQRLGHALVRGDGGWVLTRCRARSWTDVPVRGQRRRTRDPWAKGSVRGAPVSVIDDADRGSPAGREFVETV